MDSRAANNNHIQCPSWPEQNSWPTPSTQGLCMNLQSDPQTLGLASGSGSAQRPLFGHPEASAQNCMSSLNSLPSANDSLLKAPNLNSIFSSGAVFHNPVHSAASHGMSFVSQTPYMSSGLAATSQGKPVPPPALSQQNQEPQPCGVQSLPAQTAGYKMFQTQLPGHRLQNPMFGVSPCGANVNMPQATFGGQNADSRYPNSFSSAASMEQQQWAPSSGSEAVPDVAAHPNKSTSCEKDSNSLTDAKKRRSSILSQRAELLKQLEDIDKVLKTLPPDDSSEGEPSSNDVKDDGQEAGQSPPTPNCPSPSACNTPGLPASPGSPDECRGMDNGCSESEADNGGDSDYVPQSEVSFSDSLSDDDDSDSKARPENDMVKIKEQSEDDLSEEENGSSPKQTSDEKQKTPVNLVVEGCGTKKTNYCLFCERSVIKMARHLTKLHSDRVEVAVAFQYPVHSMERMKIWRKLINEGNFKHNKNVLKTGKGQLAGLRTSKSPHKAIDFVHCLHCHGLYKKRNLFIHLKRCKESVKKEEKPEENSRRRIIAQCALLTKNCEGISEEFKGLLGEMVYDDVSETLMEDQLLLQFGEKMFNDYKLSKKRQYVRGNLRIIARLLLEAKKSTPITSLEDFFKPSNFKHLISSVKALTGYDQEKKRYARGSLAVKLGYHLTKICDLVQHNAQSAGDIKTVEGCKIFHSMYRKKWTKRIRSTALSSMRGLKKELANKVPRVEDVKRLHYHLEKVHHIADQNLRENSCPEHFVALAKAVLARAILFNRRLADEVSSITLTAFQSRIRSDACDDMDVSVSELERKLCGLFSRVDVKGRCGRVAPVILKPSFESSMELLIDVREACGVFSSNPYVFPRRFAKTFFRGCESIQIHAKECGAEDPAALTVRQIRRHFSTVLQLLNLNEEQVKQILGPSSDIQVLREINNLMCDDNIMDSTGPLQFYQQRKGAAGCSMPGTGLDSKAKLGWSEAEIQAVEKHLKSFIKNHKIPHKEDCIRCLEAEPLALKERSWRGVKDFVRNRITTLQRQAGSTNSTSGDKPQQSSGSVLPRKAKPKWGEAEVRAVEKHLMRFIKQHKLPQKDDCTRCLDAEPHALRDRSWKGVKDYVRNRITTLQRQSGFNKDSSKTKSQPRKEKSQSSGNTSMGRLQPPSVQPPASEPQNMFYSCSFASSYVFQAQTNAATTSCSMTAPPNSARTKQNGLHKKSKHTWNEAEVQAVEKHLMNFIFKQKLPHKDDCVACLSAEPHALKNRTWKGVKDYVRNRITTLQRQNGVSRKASNTSRSKQNKP